MLIQVVVLLLLLFALLSCSEAVSKPLLASNISTTGLFWLLNILYCVIHYGIASQTAHVTAVFPPFLGIMMDVGEQKSVI